MFRGSALVDIVGLSLLSSSVLSHSVLFFFKKKEKKASWYGCGCKPRDPKEHVLLK